MEGNGTPRFTLATHRILNAVVMTTSNLPIVTMLGRAISEPCFSGGSVGFQGAEEHTGSA